MISSTQQIGTNVLAALAVAGSCTAAAQAEAPRRDDLAGPWHRAFVRLSDTEAAAAKVLIISFPQPLTAAVTSANDEAFIKLPRETTERERPQRRRPRRKRRPKPEVIAQHLKEDGDEDEDAGDEGVEVDAAADEEALEEA